MLNGNATHPSANVRARFKVLRVSDDGTTCRVRGAGDFEFDVPRVLPIFLPSFPGESVTLREGINITAEIVAGTYDELTAVLIEDDMIFERSEFESAQDARPGVRTFGVAYENLQGRRDGWEPRNCPQKLAGQE